MRSLKHLLDRSGVDTTLPLEVFDPVSTTWSLLAWSASVGSLDKNGATYLFRYKNLSGLQDFHDVLNLSPSRLPGHKGKARDA